jgi:hypothetical protein
MRSCFSARELLALAISLATSVAPLRLASAQHDGGMAGMPGMTNADSVAPPMWHLMLQAIPVVTRAQHTAGTADLTEGYVSQAAAMVRGSLWNGHALLDATLNGEGLTMARGELSTGAFGEGYVDRRHPHTYLHELVVSGLGATGPLSYSVSAGRGFAPFGTDDPMMRPFEKYPINHHLSQILERAMVMGALRVGPAMIEAASFGGDEPTSPSSLPRAKRFGDSWSVRTTALPREGLELQASYARIASPEQAEGFGLDQRKRSVSSRYVSADGSRYVLAEWARTVERDRNTQLEAFAYETALVEGSVMLGRVGLALRLEQTDRPEEERLANPFRTPRPAFDLGISGITQWRTATVALTLPSVSRGVLQGYPFVELERLSSGSRDAQGIFDPKRFYGSDAPWMASVGVRLRIGPLHGRMGRYGVALAEGAPIRALGSAGDSTMHHVH